MLVIALDDFYHLKLAFLNNIFPHTFYTPRK